MIIMVVVAVVLTVVTAGAAAAAMGATATSIGATSASAWAMGTAALAGGGGLAMAGVTMTAAEIRGFVGSVGSQLAGKAMGVVESFSLRQAVGSGLTAGFGAGTGSALQGAKWAKHASEAGKLNNYGNMARGAASYVGAYSRNKIAGLETHFN